MNPYVKSSPHFFRPVGRAMLLGIAALLVLAALVPAPLETPADPAHAPNPAKSAWFLLWIQELVSYNTLAIYVAVGLAAFLVALPWLPVPKLEHARWLPRDHRWVGLTVIAAAVFVLALTVVGLYLRGPDWRLVLPF
jgi:hypothetical protein